MPELPPGHLFSNPYASHCPHQSPYVRSSVGNLTPCKRYRQQVSDMGLEGQSNTPYPPEVPKRSPASLVPRPVQKHLLLHQPLNPEVNFRPRLTARMPSNPSAITLTRPQLQEELIMASPIFNNDPDYELELQRQLNLLATDGFSKVYLDRLSTGSMYQPNIIPFQLTDYMAIERQQIARMEAERGSLDADQQPHFQQLQHPGAGWHRPSPASSPLNTTATRQLPQYQLYQSPYQPLVESGGTHRMPNNFAMPPPPRPNAFLGQEGSPQYIFQKHKVQSPPRSNNNASSSPTILQPQPPQSLLGPLLHRSEPHAPQPRGDVIVRQSMTPSEPQTPLRPFISRLHAQAPLPATSFRQAWQQASSQPAQTPQDEGRWYIPPQERQRFLGRTPPAQGTRQEYIHRQLQGPGPAPSDDYSSESAVHSSAISQPCQQQDAAPAEPRRGSFSRAIRPREIYVPRHMRVEGEEVQSPLVMQQDDEEGVDTDDAGEDVRCGQRKDTAMRPPARPLWTRKRKGCGNEDESDGDGSASSAQDIGGRKLWIKQPGSS